MTLEARDVHEALDLVATVGIEVVVLGGWGVDALVGEQSRPHDDLDLWVGAEHDRSLREALATVGYDEVPGGRQDNYVLRDARGREIDVHLVTFGADGTATYQLEDGGTFAMPPGTFTTGSIDGRAVRCVSGEQQMLDHADGYEPGATDRADMRLLHERVGVAYRPPFGPD